jgi:hypothetical protein
MSRPTCSKCIYFVADEDSEIFEPDERYGQCRRYAPDSMNLDHPPCSWPSVNELDWCGEWREGDAP